MLAPSQAIRSASAGSNKSQSAQKRDAQQQPGGNNNSNPDNKSNKHPRNRRRGGGGKKKSPEEGQPPPSANQDSENNATAEPPSDGRPKQGRRRGRGKKESNQTSLPSNETETGNQPVKASKGKGSGSNNNNSIQNKQNTNKRKPKKKYPWRRFLPKGSVDPITLENLQTLEYPPFALCADRPYVPVPIWPVPEEADEVDTVENAKNKNQKVQSVPDLEELNRQRLAEQWGSKVLSHSDGEDDPKKAAAPATKSSENVAPPSRRPYNLFDGRALAYYMVSQLQFIDPLNRRDLTRPELLNLDGYLQRYGLHTGDLKVTEAYDAKGITLSSAGAVASTAQGRANIMQQMAQQLLNSLFAGQSVTDERSTVGSRGRRQENAAQHQAQSFSLQDQYAFTQRQEQERHLQAAASSNSFGEPYLGDSGVYGSIDPNGGGGFMIVDDDENPELRGGMMTHNVIQQSQTREHNDFPSLAGAHSNGQNSFRPGAAYSASHIAQRYGDDLRRPDIPFPALPSRNGSPAVAAPAPPAPASQPGLARAKKGPSKTLSKISGVVKKTDPEELQRQWEAREAARKRAMLSNLSFGMNPTIANAADSLLQPPALLGDAAVNATTEEKLERNRAFAEALGVKPATQRQQITGWSRPTEGEVNPEEFKDELIAAVYPQELIALARERMQLLLKLEKRWKAFLEDDKAASLSLYPTDKPGRKLIHHYAEFWSLKTESFDPEPKRYVHCNKLPNTHMPRPLLSNAIRSGHNSSFKATAATSGLTLLSH